MRGGGKKSLRHLASTHTAPPRCRSLYPARHPAPRGRRFAPAPREQSYSMVERSRPIPPDEGRPAIRLGTLSLVRWGRQLIHRAYTLIPLAPLASRLPPRGGEANILTPPRGFLRTHAGCSGVGKSYSVILHHRAQPRPDAAPSTLPAGKPESTPRAGTRPPHTCRTAPLFHGVADLHVHHPARVPLSLRFLVCQRTPPHRRGASSTPMRGVHRLATLGCLRLLCVQILVILANLPG